MSEESDRPAPLAPPNPNLPGYQTTEERRAERLAGLARFDRHADDALQGRPFVTGPHGGLPFDPCRLPGDPRDLPHREASDPDVMLEAFGRAHPDAREWVEERRRRLADRDSHERFALMIAGNANRLDTFRIARAEPISFVGDPNAPIEPPNITTHTINLHHIRKAATLMISYGAPDRDAWLRATYNAWKEAREVGAWE